MEALLRGLNKVISNMSCTRGALDNGTETLLSLSLQRALSKHLFLVAAPEYFMLSSCIHTL